MTTEQQKSRKRRILRWVLRSLGSALVLIIALVILVPMVFKDEIVETARKAVERNVEGQFTFSDADVGLLQSFPNLCLKLRNVSLSGNSRDSLSTPLFSADMVELVLDLRSVVKKDVPVNVIGLSFQKPHAYLTVSSEGLANYDIAKKDSGTSQETDAPSEFSLEIRKYNIHDGTITYIDYASGVSLRLSRLFHDGAISFADQEIDIEGIVDSSRIMVISDGVAYLRDAELKGQIPLHISLDSSIYRIGDGKLDINALQVSVNGSVRTSPDMLFDLHFASSNGEFREFLSLLPNAYTNDFEEVKAAGTLALAGQLSGLYNPDENTYPEYQVRIAVDSARFQYPGKQLAIRDIHLQGSLANKSSSWEPESLDLPRFHFELNGAPVDGKLRAVELTGSRKITGSVTGSLSLTDFMAAYPLQGYESLAGQADINLEFNVDARAAPDQQIVSGHLNLQDFLVRTTQQQIAARRVESDFSNETITLLTEDASVDFHPVTVDLAATNLLPWYLHEDTLRIAGSVNAQKLAYQESPEQDTTGLASTGTTIAYDKISLDLQVECDSVVYNDYVFTQLRSHVSGPIDKLQLSRMSAYIRGSNVAGSGSLQNITGYTFDQETLRGQFDLRGDRLDLNAWMTDSEGTGSSGDSAMQYAIMPPGLDISARYNVDLLTYDKMRLNNVTGTLHVGDRSVHIEEMTANGLGGTMSLAGMYSTPPGSQPDFNFKYDLSQLKFVETIQQTELFELLAPIAKFIEGEFNSTLVMQGKLGRDYMPDLKSLTAEGYLETLHGKLEKAQVLEKVSSFLNIDPPLNWNMGYTRNWFEIHNGAVELKEFTKTFDDIAVTMAGKHEIQGPMSYNMRFSIPAERLRSNPVGALAQQGYDAIQKRLGVLGRTLQTVESVNVEVNVTGKLADPQIKIVDIKINQQSASDVASSVVSEAREQLVDTAQKIVDKKVQGVRDTASAILQQATDSLKSSLEQKVNQAGQTVLQQGKQQLDNRLDSTSSTLADTAKATAAEILGEKAGGEIDKIKDNLDNWNPFKKKKKE